MAAVNPTRRRLSALSGVLSGALVGRLMAGVPAATLLARFLRGVHQTLGALLQDSNLSHVIESMRTRYELAGASGPDGGMETLKSTVEAYRPAWRDQFASDPKGWRSAHDQMARAKLIPAQSQPLYHTDEIRRLAFG